MGKLCLFDLPMAFKSAVDPDSFWEEYELFLDQKLFCLGQAKHEIFPIFSRLLLVRNQTQRNIKTSFGQCMAMNKLSGTLEFDKNNKTIIFKVSLVYHFN